MEKKNRFHGSFMPMPSRYPLTRMVSVNIPWLAMRAAASRPRIWRNASVFLFLLLPSAAAQQMDADSAYNHATAAIERGLPRDAITYLHSVIPRTTASKPRARAWLWLALGDAYAAVEEYTNALAACREAHRCDTTFADVWGNMGWMHYKAGNVDSAVAVTRRCIKQDSSLVFAYGNLGLYYARLKRSDSARSVYRQGIDRAERIEEIEAMIADLGELEKTESSEIVMIRGLMEELRENLPRVRCRSLEGRMKELLKSKQYDNLPAIIQAATQQCSGSSGHPGPSAERNAFDIVRRVLGGEFAEARVRMRKMIGEEGSVEPFSAREELLRLLVEYLISRAGDRESAELYLLLLRQEREAAPHDDPRLATSINNAGSFLHSQGILEEAGELLSEALAMRKRLFVGDHIALVTSLHNLGHLLHTQERDAEAEPLLRQAMDMSRRLSLDSASFPTGILFNTANYFLDTDRLDEAERLYREAMMIQRAKNLRNDAALSKILANYGNCLTRLGRLQSAESLLREALEIQSRVTPRDHPDRARWLQLMALLRENQHKEAEAEKLYLESLSMYRRLFPGDHLVNADIMGNLANFHMMHGRARVAEPLCRESCEMRKRLVRGDSRLIVEGLNMWAVCLRDLGRVVEAEQLTREALGMSRRLFPGDHEEIANSLNNLGSISMDRGRLSDAEEHVREALDIRRRLSSGDNVPLAWTMNNLAALYYDLGRLAESKELVRESVDMIRRIYRNPDPVLARSLYTWAGFLMQTGDTLEAVRLLEESLETLRQFFRGDHPLLARAIGDMALFRLGQLRLADAESLSRESLEMSRRLFPTDHVDMSRSIQQYAFVLESRGMAAESERLNRESIAMLRRLFPAGDPKLSENLVNLAVSLERNGRAEEAIDCYVEAMTIYLMYVRKNFSGLSENEQTQLLQTVESAFHRWYSFVLRWSGRSPRVNGLLYDFVLMRKAIIEQEALKQKTAISNSEDASLAKIHAEWMAYKERLARAYALPADTIQNRGININYMERMCNDLERRICQRSGVFARGLDTTRITWRDIVTRLAQGEAAVEILRFPYSNNNGRDDDTVAYLALILTPETKVEPVCVRISNGAQLETSLLSQYHAWSEYGDFPEVLYHAYWEPIGRQLEGVGRVFISADGVYNRINLLALRISGGRFLLDQKDICLLTSTRDLVDPPHTAISIRRAALFGNPSYELDPERRRQLVGTFAQKNEERSPIPDTLTRMSFKPLPGTEREIIGISQTLAASGWESAIYLADRAVEEFVKAERNPRVLHIATHGYFLSDRQVHRLDDAERLFGIERSRYVQNPLLRSGLLFTGAANSLRHSPSNDLDNGILTAYEAQNLTLDSTELVVLSACETGLGLVRNGEGVYGLQRAFRIAGTRCILMSLWKVGDEATQELMRHFYTAWMAGGNKREAFREAQQKLREKYPSPRDWGAFVMIGR